MTRPGWDEEPRGLRAPGISFGISLCLASFATIHSCTATKWQMPGHCFVLPDPPPQDQTLRQQIQVHVVTLGGDPRKALEGSREVSPGGKGGPCRMLFSSGLCGGTLTPGPMGVSDRPCRMHLSEVPPKLATEAGTVIHQVPLVFCRGLLPGPATCQHFWPPRLYTGHAPMPQKALRQSCKCSLGSFHVSVRAVPYGPAPSTSAPCVKVIWGCMQIGNAAGVFKTLVQLCVVLRLLSLRWGLLAAMKLHSDLPSRKVLS